MVSARSTCRASSAACPDSRPPRTREAALQKRPKPMKFTLSWLKDHLDTTASLETITETLTRIGLEVEGVEDKAKALAPYVVARVISAEQHPNADRLRVCIVEAGEGAPVQVVCGAPNARSGMISVFAPPGTYIPGKDITLSVGTIRGV